MSCLFDLACDDLACDLSYTTCNNGTTRAFT